MSNPGNSKTIGGRRFRTNSTVAWYDGKSLPRKYSRNLLIITKFDNEEIKLGQFVLETSPGMKIDKQFLIRGDRNEDEHHWQPIDPDEILAWGYMPDSDVIRDKIINELLVEK